MPSMNESFKTDLSGHFTCQINGFSVWYLRPEEDSEIKKQYKVGNRKCFSPNKNITDHFPLFEKLLFTCQIEAHLL
jgi:hypothetical protein